MSLGENIRYYRKLNKLSQKEVAARMGMSNRTISAWEVGRAEPDMGSIESLCKIFHCSPSDMVDEPFGRKGLTDEQGELLSLMSRAPQEQKDAIMELLRSLYS